MYGLQAISANNGWAMSAVGITIVFTGLVMLSFSIAQLHKILALWENRKDISFFKKKKSLQSVGSDTLFSENQKETAKQFYLLARTMKDSFSLQRILFMAEISGLKSPHSSLNTLLNAKIIVQDDKGYYFWDRDVFKKIVK
ncbi:MAG: OadG family protein [Thermodesulfobacteriota bacterium]|nr:OadG family protein [Thermodesulfobacteriota bacterium]